MTDLDDATFALCLTHDVDRTAEGMRGLYYAVRDRDPSRLRTVLPGRNSYWQFDRIRSIEESLGVRSAFYFLVEKELFREFPVRDWFVPNNWVLYRGRYDVTADPMAETIRSLDEDGWEIGLHGSYGSYTDLSRLRYEKSVLEGVVGHEVRGGRQHYLNLDVPATWNHHVAAGLEYDTTLGAARDYGFEHGYGLQTPVDSLLVFPLTLMDISLPNVSRNPARAWAECETLLEEARDNTAVMTVDWHQRYFSETAFPHYGQLYRTLIERAQEMGAWVGPPCELVDSLRDSPGSVEQLMTSPDGATPTMD